MQESKETPYLWIKKINRALMELDSIPLLRAFKFDWNQFSQVLAEVLDIENLQISLTTMGWKPPTEGMGENLNFLSLIVPPLEGHLYWIMNREDIINLTSLVALKKSPKKIFSSSLLEEGFYRYLTLEVLNIFCQVPHFQGLSPKIVEIAPPNENALCLDIKITFNNKSSCGRLALTPTFRSAWENFFISAPPIFSQELTENVEVTMHLNAGRVDLDYATFQALEVGDFALLDKGSFDPKTQKGIATLMLANQPLFLAKIKQNKIKLLDFATYHEENIAMEEKEVSEETLEVKKSEEEKSLLIKELPIPLVVEVARFNITIDKLLKLQPGNFLELPTHPEQGVNITVNGKKIGKGELIYLGEALGMRILEIEK